MSSATLAYSNRTASNHSGYTSVKPSFAVQPPAEPNPLADFLPDELYRILRAHKLLNEKALRDIIIRKDFVELKERQIPTPDAIRMLKQRYSYLQLDTIRKICYKVYPTGVRKRMI